MSILGDIKDGIAKAESEVEAGENFIVKTVHTDETIIHVKLSHVEDTVEAWLTKNATSLTGDVTAMKADFLAMLKGA